MRRVGGSGVGFRRSQRRWRCGRSRARGRRRFRTRRRHGHDHRRRDGVRAACRGSEHRDRDEPHPRIVHAAVRGAWPKIAGHLSQGLRPEARPAMCGARFRRRLALGRTVGDRRARVGHGATCRARPGEDQAATVGRASDVAQRGAWRWTTCPSRRRARSSGRRSCSSV